MKGELFFGFDLIGDKTTLEPATFEANKIINIMKQNRILLSIDGPHNNVIQFKPPMVFGKSETGLVLKVKR